MKGVNKMWVIYSPEETRNNYLDSTPMFWSNKLGWCDLSIADVFTKEDTETLNLPLDGI